MSVGEPVGGEDHGLVAGGRRLGREHVHALRPRDPRDELHREQRHAARGEVTDLADRAERIGQSDDDLSGSMQREVRATQRTVRRERAHLQHDVRSERCDPIGDVGAVVLVVRVGEPCPFACAGLQHEVQPERVESRHGLRRRGHTRLPGEGFAGNADGELSCCHAVSLAPAPTLAAGRPLPPREAIRLCDRTPLHVPPLPAVRRA